MRNIIINAVNMNPGDSVLMVAPDYWSDQDGFDFKREMEHQFPGVKFVILVGDFQIVGTYPTEDLKVIEG